MKRASTKETFERLQRMIPVASTILLEKFKRRIGAVAKQLNDANVEESLFLKHQFDPTVAFGSEEVVRRLLEGSSGVTDSFWVDE